MHRHDLVSIFLAQKLIPGSLAILLVFNATFSLAEPQQSIEPKLSSFFIAIHCSKNILQLWHETDLIREYPIETGKGGLGKRQSGDHKTPVGDYEIAWMASKPIKKGHLVIEHKSWCKDNKFLIANNGPPLEKLWADPYGGDQATIMNINYPNRKETSLGYTGDCIHIHGDRRHESGSLKKSYGCIHMYPDDAKDLYNAVEVGTPVKILP
jgi:lipoprotein-anchoring transpeptidase ErfK/SrfK